jgi:hypothetical protein
VVAKSYINTLLAGIEASVDIQYYLELAMQHVI